MREFTISHELDASPAAIWALTFDPAFLRETLGAVNIEFEVVAHEDNDEVLSRVHRSLSRRPLPGFLRKLVGGDVGFVEYLRFDRAAGVLSQRIEPSVFRDRIDFEATARIEDLGDGRSRRIYTGRVEVTMAVLGKRVENMVLRDVHKAQDHLVESVAARLASAPASADAAR